MPVPTRPVMTTKVMFPAWASLVAIQSRPAIVTMMRTHLIASARGLVMSHVLLRHPGAVAVDALGREQERSRRDPEEGSGPRGPPHGGPRNPCHIRGTQPLAMLAVISLAAASRRAWAPALPAMMSAVAWPNGPQTEFIAGMFGMGAPPTPASYHALTSGSVAATWS